MANGIIIPSLDGVIVDNSVSQVTFTKFGKLVQLNALAWKEASVFSIPVGFRPKSNTYFVCEQKEGTNVQSTRIVINTDGTVTLSGSFTHFVGSFTYFTS